MKGDGNEERVLQEGDRAPVLKATRRGERARARSLAPAVKASVAD